MKILWGLFSIRGVTLKRKLGYLHKINTHEINRRQFESRESSEVNLFAVDPACQGRGWGKQLLNEFIATCQQAGVRRIVLETDKESNYGFYEHVGFRRKGSFYSPLQQEFAGKSGETYVYELSL